MKWQTPLKIQSLIFISWLLPALIFGIMIYGWPWIGKSDDEMSVSVSHRIHEFIDICLEKLRLMVNVMLRFYQIRL